jgi:hypothetical protein
MYGFYGFHRLVRIFFEHHSRVSVKKIKKSVPIREIRKIRTSIRITICIMLKKCRNHLKNQMTRHLSFKNNIL